MAQKAEGAVHRRALRHVPRRRRRPLRHAAGRRAGRHPDPGGVRCASGVPKYPKGSFTGRILNCAGNISDTLPNNGMKFLL